MTDNEKLIEDAERLIGAAVDAVAWQILADEMDTADRSPSDEVWQATVAEARALLPKLFEKAHTPTDDEREVARLRSALEDVWRVIHRDVRLLANLDPAELGGIVARALDRKAGRSEVQEPSETVLFLDDSLKMLRETLCAVQNGAAGADRMKHSERVGRIITEIDRQRPLGSNGKHGDRHTATCGCEGSEPQGEPSDATFTREFDDYRDSNPGWYAGSPYEIARSFWLAALRATGGVG